MRPAPWLPRHAQRAVDPVRLHPRGATARDASAPSSGRDEVLAHLLNGDAFSACTSIIPPPARALQTRNIVYRRS